MTLHVTYQYLMRLQETCSRILNHLCTYSMFQNSDVLIRTESLRKVSRLIDIYGSKHKRRRTKFCEILSRDFDNDLIKLLKIVYLRDFGTFDFLLGFKERRQRIMKWLCLIPRTKQITLSFSELFQNLTSS